MEEVLVCVTKRAVVGRRPGREEGASVKQVRRPTDFLRHTRCADGRVCPVRRHRLHEREGQSNNCPRGCDPVRAARQ